MKIPNLRLLIIPAVLFLLTRSAVAQTDTLQSLVKKLENNRSSVLQEKLYAHIDRTFYLTGETLWFRLYYTDASFHRSLDFSKIAYVEILNSDNKPVSQTKIQLGPGGGHGSVFISSSLASGIYTVRAYTAWMKNFGPEIFFHQAVSIVNPFTKLGLTEQKTNPAYDVQFFPEGGTLLEGVVNSLGFRAVDHGGKGIDFHGSLINERNDTVSSFSPDKFGLGHFMFKPEEGHSYRAVLHIRGQGAKTYPFPAVSKEGYSLTVSDPDSLGKISLTSFVKSSSTLPPYGFVVAHTRQTLIKSKVIFFENGVGKTTLDGLSGEGVTHITLFDANGKPVAERLIFKQPKSLSLTAATNQPSFGKRKKVSLAVGVNTAGTSANLSVAVYKDDSLSGPPAADIQTYLWLTSELKGNVEHPEYYLTVQGKEQRNAIRNLLLTHGWSRYKWEDIIAKKERLFEFIPEFEGHIVTGKVTGVDLGTGKRIMTYLSNPDKNIRLYTSRSLADGRVKYEIKDFYGPRKLIAQTNTAIDSIYDIEIFSPFASGFAGGTTGSFDFARDLAASATQRSLYMQVQNTFHEPKSDRFFIPSRDTTAFYGKPDESYWLDDYTRFPTMEEVMREYVPGVRVRKRKGHFYFMNSDVRNWAMFKGSPLVLLDGVPVFDTDKIIALDPLKVKKLEVMTRKYFLGPLSFEGITSYTTYHGDLSDFEMDRRALIIDYEGLQQYREFFSPRYDTDVQLNDRTPDVRNIVYWAPLLKTDAAGKATCEFFTPDVDGKYKVVVQGLSASGIPGSAVTEFAVSGGK